MTKLFIGKINDIISFTPSQINIGPNLFFPNIWLFLNHHLYSLTLKLYRQLCYYMWGKEYKNYNITNVYKIILSFKVNVSCGNNRFTMGPDID